MISTAIDWLPTGRHPLLASPSRGVPAPTAWPATCAEWWETAPRRSRRRLYALTVLLVTVALVALLLVLPPAAASSHEITECSVISSPGTYELVGDIEDKGNPCIYVDASDVVFDGNGHEIRYQGSGSQGRGIHVADSRANVTVKNVTVTGWQDGIYASLAQNLTVQDVVSRNSDNNGFHFYDGADVTLIDVTTRGNGNAALFLDQGSVATATRFDIGDSTATNTTLDFTARDVELRPVSDPASPPDNKTAIGRYFDADPVAASDYYFDVDLHYDVADAEGIDDSSLRLWKDDGTGTWTEVSGSTVDTENRLVSANVTSFSTFGALGDSASANFTVSIDETNSPVGEGDTLTVSATVTNQDAVNDTQTVTLDVNGTERDWTTVSLGENESETVTLEWATGDGDVGDYTATVSSESHNDTTSVTVLEGANFTVVIDETNSPVGEGETLQLNATITNEGGAEATQTITLDVDDSQRDSASVTLAANASEAVTLEWQTAAGDAGVHTATVSSEDDSNSTSVTIASSRLIWDTNGDWNQGMHNRTVSDGSGDKDADSLRLGYGVGDAGLVSYWTLDEDSGSTAFDATGNNDGGHADGPTLGRTGILDTTAYGFDGVSSRVSVPNDASLQFEGDMAISVWINTTELGTSSEADNQTSFVDMQDYDNGEGYWLGDHGDHSDNIVFRVLGDGVGGDSLSDVYASRSLVNDGEWHHVVGVREGDEIRIYVDGVLQDSANDTALDPSTKDLGIGAEAGGWAPFEGDLDEVRIYNRSLTDAEVDERYRTSINGTHTTGWKVADHDVVAADLGLKNVSATLGDGAVTAYVESDLDGDGTPDEVSDPISLVDGTGRFTADGIDTDNDRFRLRLDLEASSVTTSPIVSRVEIGDLTTVSDCGVELDQPGTYRLAGPVSGGEEPCVTITASDVVLDGQGYDVEYTGSGDANGIVANGTTTLTNVTVRNVTVHGWKNGIHFEDVDVGAIDDVNASANDEFGIWLENAANVTVSDSIVDDNGQVGIEIASSSSNTITNNTVDGNGWDNLRFFDGSSDNTASNNTLTSAATMGVSFIDAGDGNTLADNTISGNGDSSSGDGVYLTGTSNTTISGNLIEGSAFDGIGMHASSDHNEITDNTISNTTRWGINLDNSAENTIDGNTITDSGDESGGDGIYISGSSNNAIRNTTISGSTLYGVALYSSSTGNSIENSTIRDNGAYGILFDASSSNTVTDTTSANNADGALSTTNGAENTVSNLSIGNSTAPETTLDFTARDVELRAVADPASPPSGEGEIGRYFDATNTSTSAYFDVALYYESSDVEDVNESTLALWRYDANGSAWVELEGSTVDTGTQTVSENVTTFSTFAAFGESTVPRFDVAIDDSNEPVVAGETLQVNATITNDGGANGTQEITLEVDGVVRDSTNVTVNESQSEQVTLEWATTEGDGGTHTATVASEDDSTDAEVAITSTGLVWDSGADWNEGTHNRTTSDGVGDRDDGTLRLGYVLDEDGLVSYWTFDEDTGTTAFDVTGDNDGDHVDGPELGRTGLLNTTAYGFDGNSSYVRVPHHDSLEMSDENAVAVSTWVNPTNLTGEVRTPLVQKSDASYNLQLHDDRPAFTIHDGDEWNVAVANDTLSEDTWYHIVGTYDGSTARIYVDSVEENATSVSTLNDSGTWDLAIGENLEKPHRHFNGSVDEVRIYNRSLGADEVTALHQTSQNGTHTTAWRAASDTLPVDRLQLENVSATIGTTNATVYVEADTNRDGSVDEVSDPIHLTDGQDEYEVAGLGTDTDLYRLRIELETADATTTPIVSRVELAEVRSNFTVSIDETNSPILEGETLQVNATITNTGNTNDTQTIELETNGTVRDTETVALDAGENASIALLWTTASGDAGDYTAVVSSENDTDSTAVAVQKPANFTVTIDDTNEPILEGETLQVNATITNTGDVSDTQTIELATNGTVRDSQSVTLAGGENDSVTLVWGTSNGDAGTYTATVSSENDSDSTAVTVQTPANFTVAIDDSNSPVIEGATLQVNATVTNTGDVSDTQTIELATNGTVRDSQSVTLDGGKNETVTLSWTTTSGDAGSYTATVSSENDTDSTSVTVQSPANFSVVIDDTNEPVLEGDTLQVNTTITNVGDVSDTQNVTLDIDGTPEETTTVTLDGGENTSVTLSWTTASGDAGTYTATVSSENDSDSTPVTVQEPANFTVAIDETNEPVLEGETLVVNATITNTGDVSDTQTIRLETNGTQRDSQPVTLDGGQNESVTLSWATTDGDAGTYTASVSSADDSDSTEVTVQSPANFTVAIDETNEPVVEGETLQVNATVTNSGDVEDTQNITLDVSGTERDTESVTLAGGANASVTLSWATTDGDAGSYTATVSSEDDADATSVTVQVPANFSVTIDDTNEPVVEGDSLRVNATITNTGDVNATQDVVLDVDGTQRDTQSVTLAGGANESVTLEWTTVEGDAGSYTATVSSENDSDAASVTVQAPANFTVVIDDTDEPVVEGDTLQVNATITNTGDLNATQTIELATNGTVRDTQSVTLDGGENESVTLEWVTSDGDAGTYTTAVSSENDSDSTSVTVQTPANFTVAIDDTNSPVGEGDTLQVNATITNEGDVNATQTIELDVNGTQRDSESVMLPGGANESVTLTWTSADGDAGTYTATVSSENDSDSTPVTVEEPANFTVTIDDTNEPVLEGETLVVNATITNTGDVSDTQNVTLEVDGTERDSTEVTLAGGANDSVTLSWATTDGDAGTYSATVSSEDDDDSTTVTVDAPANFTVVIDDTDEPVVEGETLQVNATVTNTGDVSDTQNVTLEVDGTERDSTEVTLAGGANASVTLNWTTAGEDAGDYTATVSSEDDSDTASVTVQEPSNVTVAIDDTNEPVVEGETLVVNATITNVGDVNATQTIELATNGTVRDSQLVTLDGGQNESVTLSWTTTSGDAGNYTAAVSSENDSDSTSVTVQSPANFTVAIDETNSPVLEGESLQVNATVTNVGDAGATQNVTLEIDGVQEDATPVTLNGSESETVTLSWTTTSGDAGTYTAAVSSENDSDSTSVTVEEPASFTVTIDDTNEPVVEGDTLQVNATITNVGDVNATQTIELATNGTVRDSQSVTLDGGENETVTLSWATSDGDAGTYTTAVSSENDSDATSVTVQSPANLSVVLDETNSPVLEGETLQVNATITNAGDVSDTQNVTLDVDGIERDSTSVTLAGGASETVTLNWTTAGGDAGDYTATVSSDDDTDSTGVAVQSPANFTVAIDDTNSPVGEGDTLQVNATITNTGDATDTQTVTLELDGVEEDATTVTLNGNESETVALTWATAGGDAGTYTATVSSEDDSDSTGVTVDGSAYFAVSIADTNDPITTGSTLQVTVDVENTGGSQATQEIVLEVDGTVVDATNVTLAGTASSQETLTWSTSSGDAGTHTVTASSDDESDSTDVQVRTPANLEVEIEGTNDPVVAGEELSVSVVVENTGGQSGTDGITFEVDGETVDSGSVTVGSGETTALTFSWETSEADVGTHTIRVSSDDDAASRPIEVLESANVSVSIAETNGPIAPGDQLDVIASADNHGEAPANVTLAFLVDGVEVDVANVTVDGGASESVTFAYATSEDDERFLNVTVASEDDADSRIVPLNVPADGPTVYVASNDSTLYAMDATSGEPWWSFVAPEAGLHSSPTVVAGTVYVGSDDGTLYAVDGVTGEEEWSFTAPGGSVRSSPTVHDGRVYVGSDDGTVYAVRTSTGRLSWSFTAPGGPVQSSPTVYEDVVYVGSDDGTVYAIDADTGGAVWSFDGSGGAVSSSPTIHDGRVYVGSDDGTVYALNATSGGPVWTFDGPGGAVSSSPTVRDGRVYVGSDDGAVYALDAGAGAMVWSFDGSGDAVSSSPTVHDGRVYVGSDDGTVYALDASSGESVWTFDGPGDAVRSSPTVYDGVVYVGTVDGPVYALDASRGTVEWTAEHVGGVSGSPTVVTDPVDGYSVDSRVLLRTLGHHEYTQRSAFLLGGIDANRSVTAGEALLIVVTVENVGADADTTDVELVVDGEVVDAERGLVLGRGASRTVTLTYSPDEEDAGNRTVTVRTADHDESFLVTVEESLDGPLTAHPGGHVDDSTETEVAASPDNESGPLLPDVPEWFDSAVDYEPSPQTTHVGSFLWLTVLVLALGCWLLLTRSSRESRALAVTLLLTAARTATDIVHAVVDGLWIVDAPLAAFNLVLELFVALSFLQFAALYVREERLIDRRATYARSAVAVVGTGLVVTNPLHSLVFVEFVHVSFPFAHVGAELGPLGWLLVALNATLLLTGAGLLVRSFTLEEHTAWRPVGVLATGIFLAVVIGGLNTLERGPLPQYDYSGAGVAGFMVLATAALVGHGLHQIKATAQQSILEEMNDGIVILDDARTVVDYNGAAQRLVPDVERGTRFESLVASLPELPSAGETAITEMDRGDVVSSESSKDGHYLVQVTSVTTAAGDSIGYTVRFADVTPLHRRTMELAEKNEQLDQFASTVTHDLRNPLTVASGYVDLLEESVASEEPLDRETFATYIGHVSSSLERMRVIIDDILALARGSDAVTDPRPQAFHDVVESAWESVDTADAGLVIESSGTIEADPDRLQRILENLFRNALDHVGPGVSIATGILDDGFYVADDGPGIPDAVGEEIFEHGYSGGDGTGLGLSIVRQLADAHGWAVRLDPDHEGACFVFSGCETRSESSQPEPTGW